MFNVPKIELCRSSLTSCVGHDVTSGLDFETRVDSSSPVHLLLVNFIAE